MPDIKTNNNYKYINDYNRKHYSRITLSLKKEVAERIRECAKKENKSVNKYVLDNLHLGE
jgi:predicted HicB family RNase H-like nuclease